MSKDNEVGSGWLERKFVEDYSAKASDPTGNWYEHAVNLPSLFGLMPTNAKRVLDFGCSSGYVTAALNSLHGHCDGCDNSEVSIDIARSKHPDLDFFVWGGDRAPEDRRNLYDVVFSKLTFNYVGDISSLVKNLDDILKPGGSILISVPHPLQTLPKVAGKYFGKSTYFDEMGDYDLRIRMIHRSLTDYVKPFYENGFIIGGLDEPEITAAMRQKHNYEKQKTLLPKRLNMLFTK